MAAIAIAAASLFADGLTARFYFSADRLYYGKRRETWRQDENPSDIQVQALSDRGPAGTAGKAFRMLQALSAA